MKLLPNTTSSKSMSPDKLESTTPLFHSGFKERSKDITSKSKTLWPNGSKISTLEDPDTQLLTKLSINNSFSPQMWLTSKRKEPLMLMKSSYQFILTLNCKENDINNNSVGILMNLTLLHNNMHINWSFKIQYWVILRHKSLIR